MSLVEQTCVEGSRIGFPPAALAEYLHPCHRSYHSHYHWTSHFPRCGVTSSELWYYFLPKRSTTSYTCLSLDGSSDPVLMNRVSWICHRWARRRTMSYISDLSHTWRSLWRVPMRWKCLMPRALGKRYLQICLRPSTACRLPFWVGPGKGDLMESRESFQIHVPTWPTVGEYQSNGYCQYLSK